MSVKAKVPWDGPNPAPGDFVTMRIPGWAIRLARVDPMRQSDPIDGARLRIEYTTLPAAQVPAGAVLHPWALMAPSVPAGPPRVRQTAESGLAAVAKSDWRDPDDINPNTRSARTIHGYRVYCPLRRMAQMPGSQITLEHVHAADLLRRTVDLALLGYSGARDGTPVTAIVYGPRDGFSAGAVAGSRAWRDMQRVFALFTVPAHRLLLDAIVLRNMSVQAWCDSAPEKRRQPATEMGRLLAVLDILAEHYAAEVEQDMRTGAMPA